MRYLRPLSGLLLAVSISAGLAAQTNVTLSDTELRSLRSMVSPGREYVLYIGLPQEYGTTTERFPTLYFLDGSIEFGLILQTYRLLRLSNEVPPLLIVGIAYPGTFGDFVRNRALDFTPTTLTPQQIENNYGKRLVGTTPASGGAPRFLNVLADEIIPFVQREYRADSNDRAIFGHSYGGLFAAHVLFNRPSLFQRYLIASGAVFLDDDLVLRDEERYAASHRELPVKVVASVGSDELGLNVGAWARLRDRLIAREYIGLEFTPLLFEGESHFSVVDRTYSSALRSLYRRR